MADLATVTTPSSLTPSAVLHQAVVRSATWLDARAATWLSGLVVNLVLSLLYLVVVPLEDATGRDWAVLVGSYFAVFILADATTTNTLGADAARVRNRLAEQIPLWRILVTKNLLLLGLVGGPVLLVTAMITLDTETAGRLALTLPAVLFPVLIWLGVGNLVSVALPVARIPLAQRWAQRRDRPATIRWLVSAAVPYALCSAFDPMTDLVDWVLVKLGATDTGALLAGGTLLAAGLLVWAAGTALALRLARRRRIRRRMGQRRVVPVV